MPIVKINVDKLKEGLRNHFQTAKLEALIAELGHGFKIGALVAVILEAVVVVEKMAIELRDLGINGDEKFKAVSEFADEVIQLPFMLEPLDGPIIYAIIKGIVGALNLGKLGHNWIEKMVEIL